ncbi:hypothetical protein M0R45_015674 [Rubus argutus]|uniref:Fe2OG dioxygenase domain-containing protein n=1 Tax=Rubus argutus TaxID=59490 RepID=A0AAW1XQW6_RUBAR
MDSTSVPKELPTINFSSLGEDLKPGSSSWVSTCKQVRYALEEYGCFVALYQQLSPQLVDSIFGQSRDLFEVPLENKVKNTSEEPYRGYIGPNPGMPLYEGIAIDNVTCPQETQKFRDLMWPHGKPKFCEITHLFAKLLGDFERTVEKMLFESFGIPQEQYESLTSSNSHLLRFLKYKTPEDSETVLRFAAHTDKNLTTILVQHDVGGLEVRTKDGEWISVESAPSQFTFMAADGLQVWSNDRIKACYHRVKHCGTRLDTHWGCLRSTMDRGFIRFYTTEEAKKAESPIKAYCGVKN